MLEGPVIAIFDLEMTAWEGSLAHWWSRPGEYPEIIEIGAVKADLRDGYREIASFERLVRPTLNPILSDYIMNLTGITQDRMDRDGVPFARALAEFSDFVGCDCREICFNGRDDEILEVNCRLNNIVDFPLDPLMLRDLQPFFGRHLPGEGFRRSCTLLGLVGLDAQDRMHSGLGDSRIILGALRHLREHGKE